MYAFHSNKEYYFQMQYWISRDYIVPVVKKLLPLTPTSRILEVGCAEAGVLKAFVELGNACVGIDLSSARVALAAQFQQDAMEKGLLRLSTQNIYSVDIDKDLGGRFDLIILKDVIEHVSDQSGFIAKLKTFLNPGGCIFFGFPPWYMPFGGHQQLSSSNLIRKLPWIHLLPKSFYKKILIRMGDPAPVVEEFLEIKEAGISIERFEKMIRDLALLIVYKEFFVTNPIYKYKFGIPSIKVPRWFSSIPYLRNFYTTGVYYLIRST